MPGLSQDPTMRATNVNWTSYYLVLAIGGPWRYQQMGVNGLIDVPMSASISISDIGVEIPTLNVSGAGADASLIYSSGAKTVPYEMKDGDNKRILIFHSMPTYWGPPVYDGTGGGGFVTCVIPLNSAVWYERPFRVTYALVSGGYAQRGDDGVPLFSGKLATGASCDIKKSQKADLDKPDDIQSYNTGHVINGGSNTAETGLLDTEPVKVGDIPPAGFAYNQDSVEGPEREEFPNGAPYSWVSVQRSKSGSFIVDLKKRIVSLG